MMQPQSVGNLKQVGRALYLLGRHKTGAEIYEEAKSLAANDWEVHFGAGLCYSFAKDYSKAVENFTKANSKQRHECTYLELGKVYTSQSKYQKAIDVYLEALEFSPESGEIMTTLGLLFLHVGESAKAVMHLGNALTQDPRNSRAIMGIGSVMQHSGDFDVALSKYRVAAVHSPHSSRMWNNIGMCFFGKKAYVAAVSCLKRSLHLAPLDWIVAYNLGLVSLHMEQFVTAFHYLSAAISLKDDFAPSYANLAVALSKLGDFEGCFASFKKALSLESDVTTELNFAICVHNSGDVDSASQMVDALKQMQANNKEGWEFEIKRALADLGSEVSKAKLARNVS